jgi:hypothetical protein
MVDSLFLSARVCGYIISIFHSSTIVRSFTNYLWWKEARYFNTKSIVEVYHELVARHHGPRELADGSSKVSAYHLAGKDDFLFMIMPIRADTSMTMTGILSRNSSYCRLWYTPYNTAPAQEPDRVAQIRLVINNCCRHHCDTKIP